jgi:predicted phage tail protein
LLGHEENDMMRPIMVAVPPAAPSSLATVKGSALTITWVNNGPAPKSFAIQRAANSAFNGATNWTVSGTATNFTDTSYKQNGVPYYYRVAAVTLVGSGVAGYPSLTNSSAWSNVIGPPAGTTAITAVTQALPQKSPVVVQWTYSPSGDQTGFTVQRAVNSTFTSGLTTFNVGTATATSYSDTSTKAGTTYYFRVRAVNALGTGNWSNTGGPITAHQ